MTTVVDSHVHLWDPAVHEYPWLAAEDRLRRPFLLSDLDVGDADLAGIVVVEAGARPADAMSEVAWLERLAVQRPVIAAVVAQAPLELGDRAGPVLADLAARPLVTGVRRNGQDEPPGFLVRPDFVAGVRLLADVGLTMDACVREHQLAELIRLVDLCPEVTFVLDHLGKPNIRDGHWQPWRRDLAALAARPNAYAKLSGLTTEADLAHWQPADIARYLTAAIEVFGPDRCLFGSDWPVCRLATDYQRWLDVVRQSIEDLPDDARSAVLGDNARRVYRLT